jgi:hypothetical protein
VDPRAGLDDVEKRKFLTLPWLKLQPLGRPARSQSLYRLSYPGSYHTDRFYIIFKITLIFVRSRVRCQRSPLILKYKIIYYAYNNANCSDSTKSTLTATLNLCVVPCVCRHMSTEFNYIRNILQILIHCSVPKTVASECELFFQNVFKTWYVVTPDFVGGGGGGYTRCHELYNMCFCKDIKKRSTLDMNVSHRPSPRIFFFCNTSSPVAVWVFLPEFWCVQPWTQDWPVASLFYNSVTPAICRLTG